MVVARTVVSLVRMTTPAMTCTSSAFPFLCPHTGQWGGSHTPQEYLMSIFEKDNLAVSEAFSKYGQKTTDKPHPQLQNNRERNLIVKNWKRALRWTTVEC